MKSAQVYSMRAETARGVVWRWRAADHAGSPSMAFACYEDCVTDAQKRGYVVAPQRGAE